MTDITQINAGIVAALNRAFPNIPVKAEEITENITRPSYKVLIGETTTEDGTGSYWTRKIPVEIVYYAENTKDPKPECYRRQRQLTALLLGDEIAVDTEDGETVLYPVSSVKSGIMLGRSDALVYVHFDLEEIGEPDIFIPDGGEAPADPELMENLNMNMEVS